MRGLKPDFCLIALLVFVMVSTPTARDVAIAQGDGLPSLAPVLQQVTPAVVSISIVTRAPAEDNPLFKDPFFRRFFDRSADPRSRLSAGSGVVVDAERGHILTNHHIIANAQEIVITLPDGRRVSAELIGSDPVADIAVVKIEAGDLVALPLADSDELRVGDYVVAIGNPFGLGQTVTSGIVSAVGRPSLNIEGHDDYIQTDVSINPGNAGGPLVNFRGQLVGVNTASIAPGAGNAGVGFAIPSNLVRAVMQKFNSLAEVKRSQLGVMTQDVTPALGEALGLKEAQGALVTELVKGSPADRVGIRRGDLISSVDGQSVGGAEDLSRKIELVKGGDVVVLTVVRNGRSMPISARVDSIKSNRDGPTSLLPFQSPVSGAAFRNGPTGLIPFQSPVAGAALRDRPAGGGVLVESVEQGSPAWRDGLRQADVIATVDRTSVGDVAELETELEAAGATVVLQVRRSGNEVIVVLRR